VERPLCCNTLAKENEIRLCKLQRLKTKSCKKIETKNSLDVMRT